MVRLYGKTFSRRQLLRRIGSLDQVGGVKLAELSDGAERGVRAAFVRTGSGLYFTVLLDRGMDISRAEYNGIPLGWRGPTGDLAPQFFEPQGTGWLRGFFGGLLTTCGLTYLGAPTVDEGEELGLHGRISYIPASNVYAGGYWEGDDYWIVVKGRLREVSMFGPNIVLEREIRAKLGSRKIHICDRVVNEGWRRQPLMILYHFNIGWPLVDENARLVSTSVAYVPRDGDAWVKHEEYDLFEPPTPGFRERVYFHIAGVDGEGYAYAGILNEHLGAEGLGIYIKYPGNSLSRLVEWKMNGEGEYVVGVEPANCLVMGRDKEREWGTLEYLEPGESREFRLEVGVLACRKEMEEFKRRVEAVTGGKRPKLLKSIGEYINTLKRIHS